MKNSRSILLLPILLLLFIACEKDEGDTPVPDDNIYAFVHDNMHSYYLWYDEVPFVDFMSYSSPSSLLDALRDRKDQWSFIDKTATVIAQFEEGEYFGFGFYLRIDENDDLRVPLIYPSSTAYEQGLRKGDNILSINGILVQKFTEYDSFFDGEPTTMTFEIRNKENVLKSYTLSKETVVQSGVFYTDLIENSGKKIGYIVYDSFLGYSAPELEASFTYFSQQNVDELIVDLRYNGGGYISIAEEMASMIAPASCVGKPLYSNVHNDLIATYNDTTVNFMANELNLNLERVFFITSENTASASELVINCLNPYMDVYTIGSKTHGKPVGMHGFEFEDWVFFPVVNYVANSEGFYNYLEGLSVDKQTAEGLDKDWGDITDPALSQALHFISSGSFDWVSSISTKSTKEQLPFGLNAGRKILLLDR